MTDLLTIDDLRVSYPVRGLRARPVPVLREISLTVRRGETLGLVGESGSGKTTLGRAVLGLVPVESGRIVFAGERIDNASRRRRRRLGADLQVVFQDPYSSLNPARTIGDTLTEPLLAGGTDARAARRRVGELLDGVGLPADAAHRLPREFSGGQRQRVAIARALALEPALVVCDEAVSALDLTTRKTVLDLLLEIQERTGVAYLFITHDLSVVRYTCHRIAVLRDGRIVETGDAAAVTAEPSHPYTRSLLLAAPVADVRRQRERRTAFEADRRSRTPQPKTSAER
ncbi:ATP-binding cassette domain-containing protein [Actinomadura gamaensis]|uniref:ATP-binding cassette domain-containing protein n=1 Tax=Actinomadura gamaensis TaxID=1763541 RepID=A0ABV9TW78_9ACTN